VKQKKLVDALQTCILYTSLFAKNGSNYNIMTDRDWIAFYARKQLLLSARLSRRNSVLLSVCLSVRHTGGSVKNGAR